MAHPSALTTRRGFIGAAGLAIPLAVATVPSFAAAPAAGGTLFNERLAAFEKANAAFLETCKMPDLPDEIGSQACLDAGAAYDIMIETPAPDLPSLARKLDALVRWSSGCEIPNDEIEMLAADARHLVGGED